MQINQLRYFQVLARSENYHTAAQELFISQPSLYKSIQQLQNEIGFQLFEKSGRNIKLTEAGIIFLMSVNQCLYYLDSGIQQGQEVSQQTQASLSIGTITPAFSTIVMPIISKYLENPKNILRYQTLIYPTEVLVEKIFRNEVDLIFCSKSKDIPNLAFVPVIDLPYYLVVNQTSPYAEKEYVVPEDLNGVKLLFSTPGAYATTIEAMLKHFHVNYEISAYANEELVLLDMVRNHQGVFISTDYPQLHSEGIKLIPLKQEVFHRYIYMAYRTDISHVGSVWQFVEYIKNNHEIK